MCLYLYIHNKYTQYTHIYIMWLIAIDLLTAQILIHIESELKKVWIYAVLVLKKLYKKYIYLKNIFLLGNKNKHDILF